jgi:hypothetical protein
MMSKVANGTIYGAMLWFSAASDADLVPEGAERSFCFSPLPGLRWALPRRTILTDAPCGPSAARADASETADYTTKP